MHDTRLLATAEMFNHQSTCISQQSQRSKDYKKNHTPDVEQKTQKVCGTFGSTEVFCMCWIHSIWASVLEEKKSKTGSYP